MARSRNAAAGARPAGWTNLATFRSINGGTPVISGSVLTNYNAATDTLTGGRWEVVSAGSATLPDIQSSPIVTLAAAGTTVRLSGAGASFPQLSGLTNITGTIALENGRTLATRGNMVIPGRLQYGLPAQLNTTRTRRCCRSRSHGPLFLEMFRCVIRSVRVSTH